MHTILNRRHRNGGDEKDDNGGTAARGDAGAKAASEKHLSRGCIAFTKDGTTIVLGIVFYIVSAK